MPSKKNASKAVQVSISDMYEKDGRLMIRYAVSNHGSQPFSIDTPLVYRLDGVRSPQSLYAFVNSQLGDEQVSKLKVKQETRVKVHIQSEQIAPGEQVVGVVALQMAASQSPTVLRLDSHSLNASRDGDPHEPRQAQVVAFLVR